MRISIREISSLTFLLIFTLCFSPVQGQETDTTIRKTTIPVLTQDDISIEGPEFFQKGKAGEITITLSEQIREFYSNISVSTGDMSETLPIKDGQAILSYTPKTLDKEINLSVNDIETTLETKVIGFPLWLSILPPLIAILLALIFREVIVSLFIGIFSGAAIIGFYHSGGIKGIFSGFLTVLDTYIIDALADKDHLAVLVFSMLIGGMVALISKNGGMQGIVNIISRFAKTAVSGQFSTWLLGLVIFFDDYANTLVVGNTMRSVTDKLRISREKLSYLVDSTAAPVSALAFITTWIGAELGYIQDGISQLGTFPEDLSPYSIFLSSLQYSFYPILTLIFMLMLVFSRRDFGPMYKAETRARTTGKVVQSISNLDASDEIGEDLKHFQPIAGIQYNAWNAIIPVLILVIGVFIGLMVTGYEAEFWNNPETGFFTALSQTIGNSDSYASLLWASLSAVVVAIILTVGQKMMNLIDAVETMTFGFKAMMGALMILTMAWALQLVTNDMHTADFLTALLGEKLSPVWIPAITFLLAALVSFSTGSSWSTMAILYPLILPLTWQVSMNSGLETTEALPIFYNVVASLLAGSVLGDHCSPISDTTILSSLACSCNHIDHVRTQLPYALVVGGVGTIFGTIPTALGFPAILSFLVSVGAFYLLIRFFGKPVPDYS